MNPIEHVKINKQVPSLYEGKKSLLVSPEARNSFCFSQLLEAKIDFPSEFPLKVTKVMKERINWLLGLPQTTYKTPYMINGKCASEHLNWVKEQIGLDLIIEEYFVGSAMTFAAGKEKFEEAVSLLKISRELSAGIHRRIEEWKCKFNDLDFRLKVKNTDSLEKLAKELKKSPCVNAQFFKDTQTLIIAIEDDQGHKVEFFISNEFKADYALNTDNWRYNLKTDEFESSNGWGWLQGQLLKVILKKETNNSYIFLRLLKKEMASYTSHEGAEETFFRAWNPLKYLGEKDKDFSIEGLFRRLRIQQLGLKHLEKLDANYLFNQTAQVNTKIAHSNLMHTVFYALNEKRDAIVPYMHAALECIALTLLREGCGPKIQVKLVQHEGEPHLRLRLDNKDLLLGFHPAASINKLMEAPENLKPLLRKVMHAVLRDGIQFRETTKDYRKSVHIHVNNVVYDSIKNFFMHGVKVEQFKSLIEKPLAEYLIPLCSDPKELLQLGLIVLENYDQDAKEKLCWLAVEQCFKFDGLDQAIELTKKLRKEGLDPTETLFVTCLIGNSNVALLEVLSPWNIKLNWEELLKTKQVMRLKKFLEMVDSPEIPADVYIQILKSIKSQPKKISEDTLTRILNYLDPKYAVMLLQKYDDPTYNSKSYVQIVSKMITENRLLRPIWVLEFMKSGRFEGDDFQVCTYLLSQNIETVEKSNLLKALKINNAEELWRQIAAEYLQKNPRWPRDFIESGGIPQEILVQWCNIIEVAQSKEVVLPLLQKIEKGKKNDLGGIVLMHFLKNWKLDLIDKEVLSALVPLKWENIVANAKNPLDVLRGLKDTKTFPIYTSLMGAIKPKDEHFFTWWIDQVEKMELSKLLDWCTKRSFKDCLKIAPKKTLKVIEKIISPERVDFILQIFNNKDEISENLFKLLLLESFKKEDKGFATESVLDNSPERKINDKDFIVAVVQYVDRLLDDKNGSLDIVARLWRLLPLTTQPVKLAPFEKLLKLIKSGNLDLVLNMLRESLKAGQQEINPALYCEILKRQKTLDEKISLLLECRVTSDAIKKIWGELVLDREVVRSINAIKNMISIGHNIQIKVEDIQNLVLKVLPEIRPNTEIDPGLIDSMYNCIEFVAPEEQLKLWIALKNSVGINEKKLWNSGLCILKNTLENPSPIIIKWLIKNFKNEENNEFSVLIPNILSIVNGELKQNIVNSFLKKQALEGDANIRKLFWKHTSGAKITVEELAKLQPNDAQRVLALKAMIVKWSKMTLVQEQAASIIKLANTYSIYIYENCELCEPMIALLVEAFKCSDEKDQDDFINKLAFFMTSLTNSKSIGEDLVMANLHRLPIHLIKSIFKDIMSGRLFIDHFQVFLEYLMNIDNEEYRDMLNQLQPELLNYNSKYKNDLDAGDFKISKGNEESANRYIPQLVSQLLGHPNIENIRRFKEFLNESKFCLNPIASAKSMAVLVDKVKWNHNSSMIEHTIEFILGELATELFQHRNHDRVLELFAILEETAFLILADESFSKYWDPMFVVLSKLNERSPKNDSKSAFVLSILVYHQKQSKSTFRVENEWSCTLSILFRLQQIKTKPAMNVLCSLMPTITYNQLYSNLINLNVCNRSYVETVVGDINTPEQMSVTCERLLNHLLIPAGNDVDIFLTGNETLRRQRLTLIKFNFVTILRKFQTLVPNLVVSFHYDMLHLYTEADEDLYCDLISTFFQFANIKPTLESGISLALLLLSRPVKNLNALLPVNRPIEEMCNGGLLSVFKYNHIDAPFPDNNYSEYYPYLAFAHYMKKCEENSTIVYSDVMNCFNYFEKMNNKYASKRRLFNLVDKLFDYFISNENIDKKEIERFIFKILKTTNNWSQDYKFELGMKMVHKLTKVGLLSLDIVKNLVGKKDKEVEAIHLFENFKTLNKNKNDVDSWRFKTGCNFFVQFQFFVSACFSHLKHTFISPIYMSKSVIDDFYLYYDVVLSQMFIELKASDDKMKFFNNLNYFRKLTEPYMRASGISDEQHFERLLKIFEDNIFIFDHQEDFRCVLELIYNNLNFTNNSFPFINIAKYVARFIILSFYYGPNNDQDYSPNVCQLQGIALMLDTGKDRLKEDIQLIQQSGVPGAVISLIQGGNWLRISPNNLRLAIEQIVPFLEKCNQKKSSLWFQYWIDTLSKLKSN